MNTNLPIIDLASLVTTPVLPAVSQEEDPGAAVILPAQKKVAKDIREACETHGFFYVKNHGIDPELIKSTLRNTRDFFSLSSTKKAALSSKSNPLFRGYISTSDGLHTCNTKEMERAGLPLDQKESFTIGAECKMTVSDTDTETEHMNHGEEEVLNATSPMHGPNQWPKPSDLQSFKRIMNEYWDAQIKLCRIIARGLALSLDLNPSFFDEHLTDPVAQMVLLKYPPPPQSIRMEDGNYQTRHPGCGEHTDCGFLTILAQDLPGLEVQDPHTKEWKCIEPKEDMFVVNLGDMAARWTNDVYKSTKHRVYNQTEMTRYSIPFFCNCNFDAPVKCIMGTAASGINDSGVDAKYEPTTAGLYILEKLGLMRKIKN